MSICSKSQELIKLGVGPKTKAEGLLNSDPFDLHESFGRGATIGSLNSVPALWIGAQTVYKYVKFGPFMAIVNNDLVEDDWTRLVLDHPKLGRLLTSSGGFVRSHGLSWEE
ncbi:hypothetical protein V6N13_143782 [Hibiscus sabdariffa]|uniref:Uncharacterized protein n=1 Tax=Hibiscus sabdariffa TaxID=183260 RepID=A0ABR2FIF0_9ROSI